VPLEHSSTDAARSRNIGRLRREGYPPKQAAAIAYKEQRKSMKRSRRRRSTGLARVRRNPDPGAVPSAIGALTLGALVGAGAGAITQSPAAQGALAGTQVGVAVTGVGGLLVAIFSEKSRMAGLATAGIGLGGLALFGLASTLISASKPATTTA
jgi:hypothetical protein